MKITKSCVYTNRKNTLEVDITEEQYQAFRQGGDIDEIAPTITYEERQFLLTGALPGDEDGLYDDDIDEYDDRPSKWEW